jgi:hypothetical protein
VVNIPGLVLCLEVELALVISAAGTLIVAEMILVLMPLVQMVFLLVHVLVVAMEAPFLVSDFQVQKPLPVRHVWTS